jgi:hypothetical protein
VIDTVDLWSLENQRKISLRFLASYLLGEHIQVTPFGGFYREYIMIISSVLM